jgi:hypothetical protein
MQLNAIESSFQSKSRTHFELLDDNINILLCHGFRRLKQNPVE